ncbi:uncharacterized protein LOC143282914 [Babylonia areolata]|uniref:uncharacterized protein LOC143282914 n=1 Tax=Babylonia areolata TaxID=304850 RepID=UPI003FCF5524
MADSQGIDCDERLRVIQGELVQVKQKVPEIPDTKLIAAVVDLVKVEIKKTEHKQINITCLFPSKYPHEPLVVELNSKTLAHKLLMGLGSVCEAETKKLVGQRQVVHMVNFVKTFIDENPLSVCSEEIAFIKKDLLTPEDEIKLKQKTSQIVLKLRQLKYFLTVVLSVPETYPLQQIVVEISEHNLPNFLKVNFQAQAIEIARQCVQPPLKKKPKDPPFAPKPSIQPVCEYLIKDCMRRYPMESCSLCKKQILPPEPTDLSGRQFGIERVYCGHLFHFRCLDKYMKTPPFAAGKFCPVDKKQIFHEKWQTSASVMEQRWAHKQAKQRELEEVMDFME